MMSCPAPWKATKRMRGLALLGLACSSLAAPSAVAQDKLYLSQRAAFRLNTIAGGLVHPWAMAFLPGGDILVTERPGRLRVVRAGKLQRRPVAGLPKVAAQGQGGLMDVILHPRFAENRLIYLSYTARGAGGIGTHVARARLSGGKLTGLRVIFAALPRNSGGRHFGSRMVFGPDGLLYITSGDRGESADAQSLATHTGKVVRITDSGAVPRDNPFAGRAGARAEIFTTGHRNPQGIARHPATGRIWAVEHGPMGGDEINILAPGANYGWPAITYGRSYAGFSIGEGTHKPGMAQPIKYWVPSIAPSGLAFYTGARFPGWTGSLFVGALVLKHLNRLTLAGDRVVGEERLLSDWGRRIRDVRDGPDGYLYILTDENPGALVRLEPVR